MAERIIHKHDTSDHWALAVNFIPKAGEIIIYDDLNKIKIGDGINNVNSLEFLSTSNHTLTIGNTIFDGTKDVKIDIFNGERS